MRILLSTLLLFVSAANAQFPKLPRKSSSLEPLLVLDARKQLFLDDYLVDSVANVRRVIHPAKKHSANPVLQPGFIYGSVIRDGGKYRMWYQAATGFARVAYAESADGITWEKPNLGLVEIDGKPTNLVLGRRARSGGHNQPLPPVKNPEIAFPYFYELFGVHKDTNDPDASRRYKMGFLDSDYEYKGSEGDPFHRYQAEEEKGLVYKPQRRGLAVAGSADGIHWRVLKDFATESICDGGTHWMFDAAAHKYVLYGRSFYISPEINQAWGVGVDTSTGDRFTRVPALALDPALRTWIQGHFWGRAVARLESPDFIHWDYNKPATAPIVMSADPLDQPGDETYDMHVFPYEGIYIGLLKMYHDVPDDPVLDVQLTTSRDSVHFTRVGDRKPFIPVGVIGEWDRFNQSLATNPPIAVGDELRFYYSGTTARHSPYSLKDTGPKWDGIGFATIPRDRFVSLAASFDGGAMVTKPVRIGGRTLHLNARSEFGAIVVEALDGNDQVICRSKPVQGDALDIPVEWESGTLPQGRVVALRFSLKNAHVFAVWCS
jgi:hypothetical protein